MTALIKSGAALGGQVRALDLSRTAPAIPAEPDARDQRLAEQAARIAALEARLAECEIAERQQAAAFERDLRDALAKGHEAGLAEADDRAAERLSCLELGLGAARDDLKDALSGLERLAVLVAQTALARLVDDAQNRSDLLAGVIRRQTAGLEAGALLRVEVSASDFPSREDLAVLVRQAGLDGVTIETIAGLTAGGCRLRLRLGELEVGLDQQWGALGALLADLAAPEGESREAGS